MRKTLERIAFKSHIKNLHDGTTEKSISDVLSENTIKVEVAEGLITMENKQSHLLCISFSDDALVKGVTTGQYTIVKYQSNNKLRFLSSYGACPCVIITFYDSLQMKGGIAHLTTNTSVNESLENILSHFDNLQGLQIFVCGGSEMEDSKELVNTVHNFLDAKKLYYYSRAFSEKGKPKNAPETEGISLDIATGYIYDSVPTPSVKTHISKEFGDVLIEV